MTPAGVSLSFRLSFEQYLPSPCFTTPAHCQPAPPSLHADGSGLPPCDGCRSAPTCDICCRVGSGALQQYGDCTLRKVVDQARWWAALGVCALCSIKGEVDAEALSVKLLTRLADKKHRGNASGGWHKACRDKVVCWKLKAKAAAAASDTLTLSALRDAQERAGELSAENSRLELLLKQQAAEHARNDHDELEKLKAANDKALRDLAYEHAENQAELEQDKLQVKLEMLDVREQSSKALASQKLASDEAQRKLKADARNEQRRLLEELTAEHEAALAERKGVHAGAVEAADAVNRAAIEELRGRISEQLLASHDARSVLTNLQSQLKVEKLARSDLEAKLAAESESAHQRLQVRAACFLPSARLTVHPALVLRPCGCEDGGARC